MLEIQTHCPFCATPASVLDGLRGSSVECSHCRGEFVLPPSGDIAQPLTAPVTPHGPTSRVAEILTREEEPLDALPAAPARWPDFQARDMGCCQMCGRRAPTRHVNFQRHIGAVVLMFHGRVAGELCKRCISRAFWDCTLITLILGWWGCISMVVTPFCLLWNVIGYATIGHLPDGPD
jgi:hypothetical protein